MQFKTQLKYALSRYKISEIINSYIDGNKLINYRKDRMKTTD